MCGRYTNSAGPTDTARRFQLERVPKRPCLRYNVAPGQKVLAVVSDADGRRAEQLRWGLIPHWAKEASVGYRTINARAETVLEKRSFRSLIVVAEHRALIVADGFYEWLAPEDRKAPRTPMHFTLATGLQFAFAGLWNEWRSPQDEAVASCTILTTTPNEIVAPVHDRMPVILPDTDAEAAWLNPGLDGEAAAELLRPLPALPMQATPASQLVNSARNEGPELLAGERVAAAA